MSTYTPLSFFGNTPFKYILMGRVAQGIGQKNVIQITLLLFRSCNMLTAYYRAKNCTGCPNKHGNSVTNSISSFYIILWFCIVIPAMFTICLFMFWLHNTYGCTVLTKIRKLQYTNRVNLSVFTVHLVKTFI